MENSNNEKVNSDDSGISVCSSTDNSLLPNEDALVSMLEKLSLDNSSSSPVPSTSTGITTHDSAQIDEFFSDSSISNDGESDVPVSGVKRRKSRLTKYYEGIKISKNYIDVEMYRPRRRYHKIRRSKSKAGFEMKELKSELIAISESELSGESESNPGSALKSCISTRRRKLLRPKRRLTVTFDLPSVVPYRIDPDQMAFDDSDNADSNVSRYEPGNISNIIFEI